MGMDIKKVIREYKQINDECEKLSKERSAYKLLIQQHFDKKNIKSLIVKDEAKIGKSLKPIKIKVTKSEQVRINYLAEKLKEKLSKEIFNEIVDKSYTINDMNGLVRLLKEAGVPASEFKKFINVTENLNVPRIKQLYQIGDITSQDMKGCFEAKIIKGVRMEILADEEE
jgi:hypothetical protein